MKVSASFIATLNLKLYLGEVLRKCTVNCRLCFNHSRSCVVSEKNSRTSPRGLGQSPRFSPGRLLARVCQCCEDSSRATVRKRLASQLSSAGDDDGTAVTEYKRMRYNIDPGIGSTDGPTAVIGEVVKRSRGRPRKVSCLLVMYRSVTFMMWP